MLSDFLNTYLIISLSGSLIALVLLLIKPLIKNRFSQKWYYYAWLIVIVRLIVPFGLPFNIAGNTVNSIITNTSASISHTPAIEYALVIDNTTVVEPAFQTDFTEPVNTEAPYIPLISDAETAVTDSVMSIAVKAPFVNYEEILRYIGLLWIVTGAVLFTKKLISYCRFVRFVKAGSTPVEDAAVSDLFYDMRLLLRIKKEIPVLSNRAVGSPMLIGIFKPVIILPEMQAENISWLKYIFMHELTHYKRRDIYYKWLMQIVMCVHWFNPIVFLAGKEVNRACELSCDEAVIKRLVFKEQRAYGDTLLHSLETKSAFNNPVVSLTLTGNSKFMKRRLEVIMKFRKKSKLTVFASVMLTFILCTGAMFTGVQAETVSNSNNETKTGSISEILPVDASSLEKTQALRFTSVGARAYSSEWASSTGIEAETYKKQLDEKINWIENLYYDKNERFMLNESITADEAANTLGIRYMYENSPVYREMANINGAIRILPYGSSFSSLGPEKSYERSVFYVNEPAALVLDIYFELSEGKLAVWLVDPEGKVIQTSELSSRQDFQATLQLTPGLWSFITVSESKTGAVEGTQKIEGNIFSADVLKIPINIPELKPNESVTYGSFYMNAMEAWSVDIESFEGGEIFVADMKEGQAINHCIIIDEAPNGAAFLVEESRLYYITVKNTGNTPAKNIKGKLTIDLQGTYQSPRTNEINKIDVPDTIKIDVPVIAPDGRVSFGPYELKKGDVVSSVLKWSNDGGGLYFAIGEKYMDFRGFHSSNGKYGKFLNKDITVSQDGLYYIFVGNPSTVEPEVKDVYGIISVSSSIPVNDNTGVTETSQNYKIDVEEIDGQFLSNAWISNKFENGSNIVLEFPAWYTENMWDVQFIWGDYGVIPLTYSNLDDKNSVMVGVGHDTHYELKVGFPDRETLVIDLRELERNLRAENKGIKEDNSNRKISVDIPSVKGNGFVQQYGKYHLTADENVFADIIWDGDGYVMMLFTKENLSTHDIAALVDKGVLPLGGGKFLGAGTEITSDFIYQSQTKNIVYNLTTSADEICKTMDVPSEGDYYFYVIAKSETELKKIRGEIYIGKKASGTYTKGNVLPGMNVWIGSAGEKETENGIIFNTRNYTGDKINYSFTSDSNGNKALKLSSTLTGEYEIYFITSSRTIVEVIPPFSGNKEITLKGLPNDTISMIVRSKNVSGSLSVDAINRD